MRKKIEFIIETVRDNESVQVTRMKVYGGWIVNTILQNTAAKVVPFSSVFVPDSDHGWVIPAPVVNAPENAKPTVEEALR